MTLEKMIECTEKLIQKKQFGLNQCIMTFWSMQYSKNVIDFNQKYIVGYLLSLIYEKDTSFFIKKEKRKWYWYSKNHTHPHGYWTFHEALASAAIEILD